MPQHFVNLPGAATLPTRQYQLTGQIIDDLIAESATGVVHGPAGTGKTYAVEAALERLREAGSLRPGERVHAGVPVQADHAAGRRRAADRPDRGGPAAQPQPVPAHQRARSTCCPGRGGWS